MTFLRKQVILLIHIIFIFNLQQIYCQTDSIIYNLDSVSVVAKRISKSVKGSIGSSFYWNMNMMHELPKILGNADPLHYTQLLPGVQTNSEYDAGLHIQGCDNAHNFVSIGDVPVYNSSHLLGFFSIFNASHFPQMRFDRTSLKSSGANRLGGTLNMELPKKIPEKINGEFSVGLMSSQGTIRMPIKKNSALFVSLRSSYLNLLYGEWLKFDNVQLKYDFQDYNLTYFSKNNRSDFWLNFYYGGDNLSMSERNLSSKLKWKNFLLSALWEYNLSDNNVLSQNVYVSRYNNHLDFDILASNFQLPSYIYSYGYKGMWKRPWLSCGIETILHNIQPQDPKVLGQLPIKYSPQKKDKAAELSCFLDYSQRIGDFKIAGGVKGTAFHLSDYKTFYSIDPSLSVEYTYSEANKMRLYYGWKHQYLLKTGFSNMGLPTEFWLPGGRYNHPQYSQNFSINNETLLFNGGYSLNVEAYYKDLHHQVEYNGSFLDFISENYNLKDILLVGSGKNFGVNIMLNKRTGNLTGWLSYSFGRALRKFNTSVTKGTFPASHERIHELNVVATYRLNKKWNLGGTFVYASGTPFTAPKHFYVMNGQILSEFGEFNANRLKPYSRLDLSVNYTIKKNEKMESGVNFSLYNALMHKNHIYYRLKIHDSKFSYHPLGFVMKILPSISYYYKF